MAVPEATAPLRSTALVASTTQPAAHLAAAAVSEQTYLMRWEHKKPGVKCMKYSKGKNPKEHHYLT